PYYVTAYARHLIEFYERGVLQRIGDKGNYHYRFVDPLMQPFAILYGIYKRIISPALVIETQKRSPFENEIFNGGYGENIQDDLPF
ncbi:MAG TPA: hypothetical protein VEQ40_11480, partial [Pyrinomonadaceae bacterium]|nr:hypothetical protein [Pyrinomonadaceae bacterium]